PAPASGTLAETLVSEGDEVEIGALVARIDEAGGAVAASAAPEVSREEAPAPQGAQPRAGEVRAGPAARQAAVGKGVDLEGVKGTGPRGRITSDDVARAGQRAPAAEATRPPPAAPAAPAQEGLVQRVPMSPLRRTIARRLVQAQAEAAMLTTFNEVDMSH